MDPQREPIPSNEYGVNPHNYKDQKVLEGLSDPGPEDPTEATLSRLRQLGVSFLSPADLNQAHATTTRQEYSTMFLPRAACPSQSIWQDSPDTSLEISSLALKYLDESQLSRLADQHRSEGKASSRKGPDMSVNQSLATKEFLNRYGLLEEEPAASRRNPLRPLENYPNSTPPRNKERPKTHREMMPSVGDTRGHQVVSPLYPPAVVQFRGQAMREGDGGSKNVTCGGNKRTAPAAGHINPLDRTNVAKPEINNRVLDITAIQQQPKLL